MNALPLPALPTAVEAVEPDQLLPMGRLKRSWARPALALAGIAWAVALAPTLPWGTPDRPSPHDRVAMPPLPKGLVDATRGERATMVVTGRAAQTINASLPYSTAPIEAARPFRIQPASMSSQDRALHCLTQAVYYEAGFEAVEGRRAVAQVVLNRVRHPAFPHSVCGVVYDGASRRGCQFTFTCDGSLRRPPASAAWAEAERIAREALQGQVASIVGLATHYHANYVAPYWAPRLTKIRQIGAHIFYRWPGAWGRTAAFNSAYSGRESNFVPVVDDAAEDPRLDPVASDPTDRRAPEDVGGRLDVTKGWTLSIPTPADSRARMAGVVARQGGAAGELAREPIPTE